VTSQKKFVIFRRGDGSQVACQVAKVLFVGKGPDRGTVLNFGASTQVNVLEELEDVIALLESAMA